MSTDDRPAMELTRSPMDGTWGFQCREHGLLRTGLTQQHALNVERKHIREDHPDATVLAVDLSAAAQAYLQCLPGWNGGSDQDSCSRAIWEALTGLKGVEADAYAAILVDSGNVTAAVIPF